MTSTRIFGIDTATRLRRRRLVILMYLSYVLTFVALCLRNNPALLMAPLCLFTYAVIVRFTRNYTLRSSPFEAPRPDEREASVRDYAMARSYLILAVIVIVATTFTATIADEQAWWRLHHRVFSVLCFAVNFLVLTLPEAIIAWSEPDLPKGEPLT